MPAKSPPIAVITATSFEARRITGALDSREKPDKHVTLGKLGKTPIAVIISGIGLANAACAATVVMERCAPRAVIVTGIGGAYHGSGLKQGDVAAATRETFAEMGTITKDGFVRATEMDLCTLTRGCREFFESFMLDKKLLELAGPHVQKTGPFLSVSTVTGTLKRGKELVKRFETQPLCENMEGAAVANVCARYGIPMAELRGISNMVEDRDRDNWQVELAAKAAQDALLNFIQEI